MTVLNLELHTVHEFRIAARALAEIADLREIETQRFEAAAAERRSKLGLTLVGSESVATEEQAPAEKPAAKKRKPVEAAASVEPAATSAAPSTEPPASHSEPLTLEAVRAKLAAISQAGKRTEVQALLKDFGVAKLTDLPKDKYSDILEKAGAL